MTKKILVADDSITIQKIVAMAFENEDIVVEGISNGKDAFERMTEFLPDVVLADIDMPGLTGFELSKKIKEDAEFETTKVLLLASDFEDFNETKFQESGADDHISKPFKSDDIIRKVNDLLVGGAPAPAEPPAETVTELSADSLVEEDGVFNLSETDMAEEIVEPAAPAEPVAETVMELSADSLVEEEGTFNLSAADMTDEAIEPAAGVTELSADSLVEEEPAVEKDELDEMIEDVESLKEMAKSARDDDSDELAEVEPIREEEIGDELDMAFQEIVNLGPGRELTEVPGVQRKPARESIPMDRIIPEPEDLLEKMAPSASARKRGVSGPNLIQESLSYLSQVSEETKSRQAMASHRSERLRQFAESVDTEDDRFAQVVGEQVKLILGKSLSASIEREIAGLSDSIVKSVREVIREITPGIARDIIKEEIEKIKKS
ncbi:MAG: response regulator [Nitrospinae bacterium]|nr:response regulator [Nitrospinota bacterium]